MLQTQFIEWSIYILTLLWTKPAWMHAIFCVTSNKTKRWVEGWWTQKLAMPLIKLSTYFLVSFLPNATDFQRKQFHFHRRRIWWNVSIVILHYSYIKKIKKKEKNTKRYIIRIIRRFSRGHLLSGAGGFLHGGGPIYSKCLWSDLRGLKFHPSCGRIKLQPDAHFPIALTSFAVSWWWKLSRRKPLE